MHIVLVGLDHKTTPIALRERLSYPKHQVPQILRMVQQVAKECVLLSTCNRVELYATCPDVYEGRTELLRILSASRQVEFSELECHSYSLADENAASHLFGVASGLYSLVPGEPQIQGQVAEALNIAHSGGYAGPITSALFRAALVAGKRARSETGISRNAASVSHAAVQLTRELFPKLSESSILLIGSGQMSELAARNLCDHGAQRLVVVNRTPAHAIDLAQRFGAVYHPFAELPSALIEADIVISATEAPHAIVGYDLMQQIVQQRQGRPLLLMDLALPRDIDPAVATLPGIHLYNLDDLQAGVNEGIRLRMQEVEHVQGIITEEITTFSHWLRSLSVVDTVSNLRQHIDTLRQQELARTLRQLSTLSEREAAAVQELTTRLVNKLLHTPTLRLKDAAAVGQGPAYAEAVRYLFALEEKVDTLGGETNYDRDTSKQTSYNPDSPSHRAATSALAGPGSRD